MTQQANREKNLLFFSLESWTEVRRRNGFICRILNNLFPRSNILWVCPPFDAWKSENLSFCLSWLKTRRPLSLPAYPRIKTMSSLKALPNLIGRNINETLLFRQVTAALKSTGFGQFSIWVNDQSFRPIVSKLKYQRLIYDITDDFTKLPLAARQLKQIYDDDSWLLSNANEVIVCSQALYESKGKNCERLHLIPNGVDALRLNPAAIAKLACPSCIEPIRGLRAGYFGTLHEYRFDVDLLCSVADRCANISFILIGPDCLSDFSRQKILARSNCHILGSRDYESLPEYYAHMDILINPQLLNQFTDSLDPLKLYEYAASGKPIVSTSCAGFRKHKNFTQLADNPEEFARKLDKFAELVGLPQNEEALAWAATQSWNSRVEQIVPLLGW